MADYLHCVVVVAWHLADYGCNVLIDIIAEHCLDHEKVGGATDNLHDAEIVDIAVAIEVEVRKHVRRVVEKILEILRTRCLSECSCHRLKIECKADIVICSNDSGGCAVVASRSRDCGAVINRAYSVGCHCNDSCGTAADSQEGQGHKKG